MQDVADFSSVDVDMYLIGPGFIEGLNPKADIENVFSTATLENSVSISSSSELFENTMMEQQAVLRSLEEKLKNIAWELSFPKNSNPANSVPPVNPKDLVSSDWNVLLNDRDQHGECCENFL